jgi:hypothetical protein
MLLSQFVSLVEQDVKDFSGLKDEVLVGPVKPVAERNAL